MEYTVFLVLDLKAVVNAQPHPILPPILNSCSFQENFYWVGALSGGIKQAIIPKVIEVPIIMSVSSHCFYPEPFKGKTIKVSM